MNLLQIVAITFICNFMLIVCNAQNACNINPCLNGGSCEEALLSPFYLCLCIDNWIGHNCDTSFREKNCGANSYTETGNITSPNFPNSYEYNEKCLYLVRIPEAETITFNFLQFDSEKEKDDLFVAIGPTFIDPFDLDTNNLPEGYTRYNGGPLSIPPVTYNTNQLTLFWESDRNIVKIGFHIFYTRQTDPCWQNECENGACQAISGEEYTCRCVSGWSGPFCNVGAIVVHQTSSYLITGSPLIEGRDRHSFTFNLAVYPDLSVPYSVIGTNLWMVTVFLSNQQDGQGRHVAETVAQLSSEQMSASWIPPNTMNIGSIQTILSLSEVTCQEMWFFCATIDQGQNPSTNFYMKGTPTNSSLTGCTTVSCSGVRIENTQIIWKSQNHLREGFEQQNVQFDIRMISDPEGGNVFGSNLWSVLLFGNTQADGSGTRVREQEVPLHSANSHRGVTAGALTTLSDLTTTVNMLGLTCAETPYLCVEVRKGVSAIPDFTLSGDLVDCFQISCRGINIIDTSLEIDTGNPLVERSSHHGLLFDLLIQPENTGGAAVGTNLWAVTLYASSGVTSTRISPTVKVDLNQEQSGTSLTPPTTARIANMQANLNLRDLLCSQLSLVCAVLTKGPFASPSYTLETAVGDHAMTACTNIECRGVAITNLNVNLLTGNQFQFRNPYHDFTIFFTGLVDSMGASITGSGLWQISAYLCADPDGLGRRIAETQIDLTPDQQAMAANAGATLTFPSLSGQMDLSSVTGCSEFSYFCVDLRQGENPNPDFTLRGTVRQCLLASCGVYNPCVSNPCQNGGTCTNSDGYYVCTCQPGFTGPICSQVIDFCERDNVICYNGGTCKNQNSAFFCHCSLGWQGTYCRVVDLGVQLMRTDLSISYGTLVEREETSPPLNLNVIITSSSSSKSVEGFGLWKLEVFSNTQPDGGGPVIIREMLALNTRQASIGLLAGGTAVFSDVSSVIDLSDYTCDTVPYLCVRVLKGDNPTPDFVLTGNVFGCVPSQCKGVEVLRTSSDFQFGSQLLIGESAHTVNFDFVAWANPGGASISGQNLWGVVLYTNTQIDGKGQIGSEAVAALSVDNANQAFVAGQQLQITNAEAVLNLQQLTCDQSASENPDVQVTHLCVRLEQNPAANPTFTLTGIPSDDVLSYCQRVSCQAPSPCNNVQCQNGGICQEVNDGIQDFFVCNCPNQWTGQFCELRVNFCANIQCLNGGTCHNQDSTFLCQCLFGWKGNVCETQDAVIITTLQAISRGYLGEGKSTNPLTFDISFGSDPRGSDAVGTGMWKFIVFSSTIADGTGVSSTQSKIDFNSPHQASTPLSAGGTATINGLTANLDLSDVTCAMVPYICVELQMGDTADPQFVLVGQRIRCVPVECRGVQIVSSGISLTSAANPLNERYSNNAVMFDLSLTSSPSGGSISGSNLWNVTTFLSSQPDGQGPAIREMQVFLNAQQASTSLQAGETSTITDIRSVVNLNNIVCSQDIRYLCTRVKRNNLAPVFSLNPPVQTTCTTIDCKGVEITNVEATIIGDIPLRVGESGNNVNFYLQALSNPAGADIAGTSLWIVNVFTSTQPDGKGTIYAQGQAMFNTGLGLNTPLFTRVGMTLSGGETLLDLSLVQSCESQVPYLCFTLQNNQGSLPEFTLTGFPTNDVLTDCVEIACEEPSACENHNCQNSATCIEAAVGYTCSCDIGWVGTFCHIVNPCEPVNPCQFGGRCLSFGTGNYTCQCLPGYTGSSCEVAPDPCLNLPCLNGGGCARLGTGVLYVCTCLTGYTGQNCGEQLGACSSSPCQNAATCYNSNDALSYTCQCVNGWKGVNCQYPAPCVSSPCQNNGLCNSPADGSSYTCQCQDGFQGNNCQFPNPCFSNPCQNGGSCTTDSIGSIYICACHQYYFGSNCQQRNPCYSSPCKNGGICSMTSTNSYQCFCQDGWLGTMCDIDNPCLPNPCQNAATCFVSTDMKHFTCDCKEPYIGSLCQNIDRCIPDPCQNNGVCSTSIDGALHICRCPEEWQGYNCQDPNYCASEPCRNNGFCIPNGEGTGYLCNCPTGFTGDNCENIDPCSSSPCMNGGECLNSDLRDSFLCVCQKNPVAFYGSRCQTIDPCTANQCLNGAVCEASSDGLDFTCNCRENFYGPKCEIYDPCSSNPCRNNGLCKTSTTGTSYSCQCAPGFSGPICEIAVACNPSPCLNGATCQVNPNNDNGYTCLCLFGYYGTHCVNRDLCTFDPCKNGGTCTFNADSSTYTCTCQPGFYGANCVETNPCTPNNPCQNGGLCVLDAQQESGYTCTCPRGFSGYDCQIVCPGFACANGQCIQGAVPCDSIPECSDGSDEEDCTEICGIRCDGGTKCLNASTECDGVQNCFDNTDEDGCDSMCKPNPCRNGGACLEVQISSAPDFECTCTLEYRGKTCRELVTSQNLPPGFDLPNGLSLDFAENTETGTLLFQLTASDPENDPLTYSLYDSASQSLFTIDPVTGQLFLKAVLDRETEPRYTFVVAVSDGRNLVQQEGYLTVSDVNDNAPSVNNLPFEVRISEDDAFGTDVYSVTATDRDTSLGGLVAFTILNDSVPFSIQLFSGQIEVSGPLDYEAISEYKLFINAQDYGSPSMNSTSILTVIIEDVQDSGPMFIREPYNKSIDEGTPIGTPVVTVIAVDQDTLNQNPISYEIITGNEGSYFSLNQDNGEITVVKELDKDSPGFPDVINFLIRATELGETGDVTEAYTDFTIIVNDIADEPPMFSSSLYIVTVSESNPPGFQLPIEIDIHDGDQIIDNAFTIRLEPKNVPFAITPTSAVGQATLQVLLRQPLDFETNQQHQFQLLAVEETGLNPQSARSTVQVIVQDANDNDPIFEGPIDPININEGVHEGYQVITVTATDRDETVNAKIIYRIVSGNNDNLFRMDEGTGTIVVNVQELDFETAGSSTYVLTLEALNTAEPVSPARGSSTTTITINILNLNDNVPTFDPPVYTIPISEVTEPGLTIGRVVATDPDPGPAGEVQYLIVAGNDGTFQIDTDTGNIQLISSLDRETKAVYTLTVQAQDQGSPVLNSRTTVTVNVRDFNDNDPVWSPQSYAASMREGQPANTFVTQVRATDADVGINAQLIYEINPTNEGFRIDSETGQITTTKPLDRENEMLHILSVSVKDSGNPQRSASRLATVRVTVTDVNDSPPRFAEDKFVFEIMENLQGGTTVGQLVADDPDITGTLYYDFDPILSDFNVIATTGSITTNRPLDRERQAEYQTIAYVRDSTRVDTALVKIIVLDANDHAPTFNQTLYVVQVHENSPVPTTVIRLLTEDADEGVNGNVTYRFTGDGNTQGPFTITNPTSGILTTSMQLDYESQQSYTLAIEALDGASGDQQLSGQTMVVVNVIDVNDNAPRFPDNSYTESVPEDVNDNFVIIRLAAEDKDSATTGQVLYRIIQGNSNGTFVIDPLTGEITRGAAPLDRETRDSYFLIVEAYNEGDADVPSDTAVITINIQDVNDEAPSFSQDVYTRPDLPEDSGLDTTVIIISATDNDLGAGGQVRYDIIEGNNQGIFTIDPDTGIITLVTKLPNINTASTYNLTITATDQAAPNHVTYTDVIIQIRPSQEVVPVFTMSRYVVNVTENLDIGTAILEVLATLPDNTFISYSMDPNVNPTIINLFGLHPNSGEITTEAPIDREVGELYTFTVLAINGGTVPGSAAVWVYILDENDNSPVFVRTPGERVTGKENLPAGTVVGEFEAQDIDQGSNGEVTYYISSGNNEGHFTITITSDGVGQLVTTTELDRESTEMYNLLITAADLGDDTQESTISVEVVVGDVNDNPPEFANASFTGTSEEGTLSNRPVITVVVTDRDIPSSNNLEFVIISGDPEGIFTIDSNGEIIQTVQLDREMQASYNLTILLRDTSYDSSYQAITHAYITIADTNDNAPTFVGVPYSAGVTEGPDTSNLRVIVVTAVDGDTGANGEVLYSITAGNKEGVFVINSTTGVISTTVDLDRETQSMYTLVVTAVDQAENVENRQTSTATIMISIGDINDTPPKFEKPYNGPYVISEGVPNSYIGTFVAVDLDGDGIGILYNITGEYSDLFIIDPETGVLTLRPDKVLDFEKSTGFNITIVAIDNGIPPLSGTTIIEIVVGNVNDHTPQFTNTPYSTLINENANVNEAVFTVNATDADLGPSGELRFEIIGGNVGRTFRIDPVTGKVFLDKTLNYDITQTYELLISVRDNPVDLDNSLSVNTVLTIGVIDATDLPPVFPDNATFYGSVLEHSPRGTVVDMVTPILALDEDTLTGLAYSITGDGSEIFSIDTGTGILRVADTEKLDRELQDMHMFTVIATDAKGRSASASVIVVVLDINDTPPTFDHSIYNFTIPENSAGGYSLGQVSAKDLDSSSTLRFVIDRGADNSFVINAVTGEITVADGANLNREVKDEYILTLSVMDQGTPPLTGNGIVYIRLTDINDDAPYFPANMLLITTSIHENSPVNTKVTSVTALDRDINAEIEYSIVAVMALGSDGNTLTVDDNIRNWFMVNTETGAIYVNGRVDRETATTVHLEISATDNAVFDPALGISDPNAKVIINILDENDNNPVFQPPGTKFINVTLQEGSPKGTIVIEIDALDLDIGANGHISYYQGDLQDNVFELDESTGVITVRTPIDREQLPWVNFTIGALDDGNPRKTTVIPIYVQITDINDNNPIFDKEQFTGTVSESAGIGTEVLVVTATDIDIGQFGNLTYTLSGGNGMFVIDSVTGAISVASQLDQETQSRYTLTVKARDNPGGLTSNRRESSVEVVIDILDTNEFAPVVDPEYFFTVLEGQPPGTSVGVIDAVDLDDPMQPLIFIIIGTEPKDGGPYFYIDPSTGDVFTNGSLDRDNSTYGETIRINVQVSDGGNPAMVSNTTAVITIGDINDNGPSFPDGPYYVPLSEIARVGSSVMVIRAVDPDLDSDLTYSIIGGNLDNTFIINSKTGEIIVSNTLDYESISTYNLVIQVEDEGGFTATTTLQVNISDANDQGPKFLKDLYFFEMAENSPNSEKVGQVEAVDLDQDSTITYHITEGNNEGMFTINEQTGWIMVTGGLDRETKDRYNLHVEARDVTSAEYRDRALVTIVVTDENDLWPEFSSANYTTRIHENTEVDSLVILLPATDGDIGDNGKITYHIVDGNVGDIFQIEEETGAITVAKPITSLHPTVYEFNLQIEARDLGDPSLNASAMVFITIDDTNDRSPVFRLPKAEELLELPENEPVGYTIIQVCANDTDIGVNGKVSYSLDQDEQLFYINAETGILCSNFSADREKKDRYNLILLATDHGEPTRTTYMEVTILITDKDDNLPYFERLDPSEPTPQDMTIRENANSSMLVGIVTPAIDLDLGDNAIIYYYIVEGNENNQFAINYTTGAITVIGDLDRETTPTITLLVKSTNNSDYTPTGPYNLLTDRNLKKVVIHLSDINDNGPVFDKKIYVTSVALDAAIGDLVLQTLASDPDLGGGGSNIEYSITLSDFIINGRTNSAEDIFYIEKDTGRILTNKVLTDYDGGYFLLTVMATDVQTGLTDSAVASIYVIDNNQRVAVVVDADLKTVKEIQPELVSLLENITGGIVIVDELTYYTDKNGVTHQDMTMMVIHVIDRETNEIRDAEDILVIIDDNYKSIELLLGKYNIVNVYPVLGGRGSTGLAVLEWALLAIALLLFLGALIFIIILCCLRRRLLKKIQGGSFITGSRKDLSALETKENGVGVVRSTSNAQSISGSNPLWLHHDSGSVPEDWPDSISLIGTREYEAQEASMDFFQDDAPIEVARDAVIMTSLISEKAMMDAGTGSSMHHQYNGGVYSGKGTLMHLENEKANNSGMSRFIDIPNMSNTRHYDGSVSAQLHGLSGRNASGQRGGGLTDQKAYEIRQMLNEQREDNFSQKGQVIEMSEMLNNYKNAGPTSVHIKHRPDEDDSDEDELAAAIARAAYREEIEFENALTPITEMTEDSHSQSSVTSASLASERSGKRALDRNIMHSPYRKDYGDPMFTTTSTIEEEFQTADFVSGDKRPSQRGYASKKVASTPRYGGASLSRMIPVPEETNEETSLLVTHEDSLSQASSEDGVTYTYHVNPRGVDGHSIASHNLSSAHTTDEELSSGRPDYDGSNILEERRMQRSMKTTTTTGLASGNYNPYFVASDEESRL